MDEVDNDHSGTIDFYEFLTVARLVTQQKGKNGENTDDNSLYGVNFKLVAN